MRAAHGTAFAALAAALACAPALAADRKEVVRFAPGETAVMLRGSIRGHDGVAYSLATAAGQVMQVLFSPAHRSCYFNVYAPGAAAGADAALFVGSTSGNEFGVNPTAAGAYTLQVYLMRNAARRAQTCRFRLSIEVTGVPGGVSAGVSDRLMIDVCRASAASMYGVQPRKLRVTGQVEAAQSGGYTIDGVVDKGAEGVKKLRCIYVRARRFTHVQAMTSDDE